MLKQTYFTLLFCLISTFSFSQTLVNVTPDSAMRGESLTLSITGSGTNFINASGAVLIKSGTYISATFVNSSGPTILNADFSIPLNAPLGKYFMQVDQLPYLDSAFTVYDTIPTVSLIKPTILKAEVSPNPSSEFIDLEIILASPSPIEIQIYDLKGVKFMEIQEEAINQYNRKIDLRELPNGIYFIRLKAGEDNKVLKILKN